MTCRMCGTENADGAVYCANCGTGLAQEQGGAAVATATDPGHSNTHLTPDHDEPQPPQEDTLLPQVKQHLGGDYDIDRELGRGGMAVVYKGVEKALMRTVAIKVVPPDSANVGQAAERFRREARLAASLDHPNIIPVYRVGQAGPLHYMAMKFVEGRAVDSIIESQGALPMSVAIAILKYSALGLAFAHEKKIVHRDIKGANILVDKDGRVMVSDFGIARALEEVSLTASGMVIGTPYFMSPEQCGGLKVSPQSDQYSLGVMGFQMLTGEVPFNADSMVGIIQHHYMTPVPDILQVRQDVPRELLEVIYCSLNKDPKDRFNTTKEMAQALEAVPQTDEERAEAEHLLKELSAGHAIPKVRTGTLPPLALTISGPAAPVQPRPLTMPKARPVTQPVAVVPKKKKKKKNKMLMPAIGIGVLSLAAVIGIVVQQSNAKAAHDAFVRDSTAKAQLGHIVIAGLPAGGLVEIQGTAYKNDDVVTLPAGNVAANASAAGYISAITSVPISAGKTDTLRLSLQPTNTQVATSNNNQLNTIQSGTTAQSPASRPSGPAQTEVVRMSVTPLTASIVVDGNTVASGRTERQLTVGTHQLHFALVGCPSTYDTTLTVTKGTPSIVLARLNCQ